ncbi:MAG: hypothetical protein ACTTKL_06510 [Treponema sp.]
MPINIELNKKAKADIKRGSIGSSSYDMRYGFWGVVTEVHSEDCTVHVRMENGIELSGVRVASQEWVTAVKDKPLTGERKLPSVDTYVFCLMPTGEYSSAFVLCSGFARAAAIHGDFKKKDKNDEAERLDNSGWKFESDYKTGTKRIQNKAKDPTITLEVNQEDEGDEKVNVTIHGTKITVTKDDGITIETDKKFTLSDEGGFAYSTKEDYAIQADGKDAEVKTDGALNISAQKDAEIKAGGNVALKAEKTGTVEVGNSIATLGAMVTDLLGYLAGLKTVGSPASHTAAPDFIAQIQSLKAKWGQVFK